jgi:hypothetical protein
MVTAPRHREQTLTPGRLRVGPLVLHVPTRWRVIYSDGQGDYSEPSHYQGFAHVTPAKTAYYSTWTIGCGRAGANGVATPSFYFQQFDWYLPVSKVLIMTEYNIPGLANILASASWR